MYIILLVLLAQISEPVLLQVNDDVPVTSLYIEYDYTNSPKTLYVITDPKADTIFKGGFDV